MTQALPSGSLQSSRGRHISWNKTSTGSCFRWKKPGSSTGQCQHRVWHRLWTLKNAKRKKEGKVPQRRLGKKICLVSSSVLLTWEQSKSFPFLPCPRLGEGFRFQLCGWWPQTDKKLDRNMVHFIFLKGVETAFRKPGGLFCLPYKLVVWLGVMPVKSWLGSGKRITSDPLQLMGKAWTCSPNGTASPQET